MIKIEKWSQFKDQTVTQTVEMEDCNDKEIELFKEVVRGVYLDNMEILKPPLLSYPAEEDS